MTPERKVEIDKQIAWWCQQEEWRVNGFGIACNDPLFAPRVVQAEPEPDQKTALWCRLWLHSWMEFEKDFTFTGRIKYTHRLGKFVCMAFEVTWEQPEHRWKNLWRETFKTRINWVDSNKFEWREEEAFGEFVETIIG